MKSIWVIIALIVVGWSCDDEKKNRKSFDGFLIKTGQSCGWCGGYDTLVITAEILKYDFINPCDGSKRKQRTDENTAAEWNELLAELDYETFAAIEVNTCQLCVDGCDTWISIQKYDMEPHVIRFVESSPEIAPILEFVRKLDALQAEFRNN